MRYCGMRYCGMRCCGMWYCGAAVPNTTFIGMSLQSLVVLRFRTLRLSECRCNPYVVLRFFCLPIIYRPATGKSNFQKPNITSNILEYMPAIRHFIPYFVHIILPLLLGGGIYVLFRATNLILFQWLHALGLADFVETLRAMKWIESINLPNWILYSLPDALWLYAFTQTMILLWKNVTANSFLKWMWPVLPLLIAFCWE